MLERRSLLSASLWTDAAVPAVLDAGAATPSELGVRFSSDTGGYITGLRFYKGPRNTEAHVGSLWTADGAPLARATFVNETASGWQQVNFESPVPISANTSYVASYYTQQGYFSYDEGYFAAAGVDSGPLHAPQNGVGGANGLYASRISSGFPKFTENSRNYWVDVVFDTSFTPKVTAVSAFDGDPDGVWDANITATFNGPMNAGTVNADTVQLRDASNAVIPAAVSYDAAAKTVTLNPDAPLTQGSSYSVVVLGGAQGVHSINGTTLAADFTSPFQAVEASTYSVWENSFVPAARAWNDPRSVEVGVKFRSDLSGYITGVRFYKGAGNGGSHIGNLWTSTGTLLATATFAGETAQGWQQVTFNTPVAIDANTTYVASYLAPAGHYSVDVGYFASRSASRGPLHALRDGMSGSNGVYAYSAVSTFPTVTQNSNNYWVDPIFFRSTAPTTPDLRPEDDSGWSDSDNVTNSTAPTFTGTAKAGNTVRIFANGLEVGSAVADAQRRYSVVASGMAEGTYAITASTTGTGANGEPVTLASPGSLQVLIDRTVAAPSTPDLDAATDSGSSTTDNLTNSTAPVFSGTAEADSFVTLFSDGVAIMQQLVGVGGTYQFTAPTLTDGTRQITAQAMDAAGNAVTSAALPVVIDSTAPVADVIDVAPDPRNSSVAQVQITFSEPVAGLTASALQLTRDGAAVSLAGAALSGPAADGRTYTLSNLAGSTAALGAYALTYIAAGSTVRDPAGNGATADASDAWVVRPNSAPTNVGVTPTTASDPLDVFRTFEAQYRDVDGAADIDLAYLRVSSPSTGKVLTALYYGPSDKLYLLAENGSTLLGGFTPGSANTITNTLGTLDVANTTLTRLGDTLTVNWSLSGKSPMAGTNSTQLLARDRASAWSPLTSHGSWAVASPVNIAPVNLGITPSAASDDAGTFRTFVAQYRDTNGASDIDIAYLRIHNTSTGQVLTALWYGPNDKVYLLADNGSTLIGGFVPGSANTISNSLGTLDVANTTLTRSGDVLTVNWALSPKATLAGSNSTQLLARDRGFAWSPLTAHGSWSVSNPANIAPTNAGLTPAASSDPAGTLRMFTAQYGDADGASDIDIAYLRVHSPSTGKVLTALYYSPTNRLYLLSETGALLGGYAPGSANTITNSLGTLDVANTSVSRSGNTMTVNWAISAKATMAGTNNMQLMARDRSFGWSPLTTLGTWTIA